MKEIYKKVLLISVICLTLGNSLPIECQPDGKKAKDEGTEIKKQECKKISTEDKKVTSKNRFSGKTTYSVVLRSTRNQTDAQFFRKYFGTKSSAKFSFMFAVRCFVVSYILVGFVLGKEGQVPEMLVMVGIITLIFKYFF